MSTFSVPVVRIGNLAPHPDADTLDITSVGEYPVIVSEAYLLRKGGTEFQ